MLTKSRIFGLLTLLFLLPLPALATITYQPWTIVQNGTGAAAWTLVNNGGTATNSQAFSFIPGTGKNTSGGDLDIIFQTSFKVTGIANDRLNPSVSFFGALQSNLNALRIADVNGTGTDGRVTIDFRWNDGSGFENFARTSGSNQWDEGSKTLTGLQTIHNGPTYETIDFNEGITYQLQLRFRFRNNTNWAPSTTQPVMSAWVRTLE